LVFITEVESVYSPVRTDSLYKADTFGFNNRGGKCLQRGTDDSLNKADKFGFNNRGGKCLQHGRD
jgi:hypothetical protein